LSSLFTFNRAHKRKAREKKKSINDHPERGEKGRKRALLLSLFLLSLFSHVSLCKSNPISRRREEKE
jgi:hypothetical protein